MPSPEVKVKVKVKEEAGARLGAFFALGLFVCFSDFFPFAQLISRWRAGGCASGGGERNYVIAGEEEERKEGGAK